MTALGRLGESNRFRASLCGSPHPADSLAALLSLVLVSVKLSDLGVDLVDLAHPRRIRFTKTHSRHALDRRPSDLPSVDHRLTHAMLGRTDVLKTGSKMSLRRYFLIVLRDNAVRRSISRIGIPWRKCQRRITLNKSMLITPHPPTLSQGTVQTWVNSQ